MQKASSSDGIIRNLRCNQSEAAALPLLLPLPLLGFLGAGTAWRRSRAIVTCPRGASRLRLEILVRLVHLLDTLPQRRAQVRNPTNTTQHTDVPQAQSPAGP